MKKLISLSLVTYFALLPVDVMAAQKSTKEVKTETAPVVAYADVRPLPVHIEGYLAATFPGTLFQALQYLIRAHLSTLPDAQLLRLGRQDFNAVGTMVRIKMSNAMADFDFEHKSFFQLPENFKMLYDVVFGTEEPALF